METIREEDLLDYLPHHEGESYMGDDCVLFDTQASEDFDIFVKRLLILAGGVDERNVIRACRGHLLKAYVSIKE